MAGGYLQVWAFWLLLVIPAQASLSDQLIRAFGPNTILGFTPAHDINVGLGGIGEITQGINNNLGGLKDLNHIHRVGELEDEFYHMDTLVETSLGRKEAMQLSDMSDIANMNDLKNDLRLLERSQQRTKPRRRLFSHPETALPAVSGMTKLPAFNITLNVDTTCHLPQGPFFRRVDGTCAHPDNHGAAFTPITRLLQPMFEDGIQMPRMYSVSGRLLPSPRVVSRHVHTDQSRASQFTIMLMQWGQFMDHDMVSTPLPIEDTRDMITCCGPNKTIPQRVVDPECFPILFHGDDKFIGQCMEFVRSMPLMDDFGEIKLPRNNMNAVTAFVDGSTVYGSKEEVLEELRTNHGTGYLFKLDQGKPVDNHKDDCIKREGRNDICYLAGDERVNEHAGLTAIHTVFMRLHNRWAEALRGMNPWMPDEIIFQRTRALVVGIIQKIMYHDWLPIILGQKTVIQSGLFTRHDQYSHFNARVDPSIFSAFSTAVFRFGHTLIPKEFNLGRGRHEKLRDLFFKPYLLFENFEDICINLVTGYTDEDRSQQFDRFITEEVTNHLFETQEGLMKGFDLVALNLQRSRDHGLPPYNAYREYCGLHRIKSFDDPALGESGRLFSQVYDHPDDIELFTGGVSEPSAYGGLVGETFNCLIAHQLHNIKYGDRYFFSHNRGEQGFNHKQIAAIHGFTLSHLMCETTKLEQMQVDALRVPSYDNPMVSCEMLRRHSMDLSLFAHS